MIDRSRGRNQLFELMLREIADRQIARLGSIAGQRRRNAGEQFDQRRFAGAVRAEQRDAVARRKIEFDAIEHVPFAITRGDVIEHEQWLRQLLRFAKFKTDRRCRADRRDVDHAFQRLDAALRLPRFRRLRAETIDELLQVRAFALLFVVLDLVLDQPFGALAFKAGEIAGEQLGLLIGDVQHVRDDGIEEFSIVRNQQQRSLISPQPGFEPDDRVEIQMVGRFVEQQQIRTAHQRLRQIQAHAPAAGKFRDAARFVAVGESQSVQQFAGARVRGVAIDGVETLVDGAYFVSVVFVFGFGQIPFELAEFDVAVEHVVERAAIERGDFLAHECERPVARTLEMSRIGRQFAGNQTQ